MTAKTMVIPRRPVGLGPSKSVKHVKDQSLSSSSLYSEPAELDIPRTNHSEHSLESVQLDDDIGPHIPIKDLFPPVPSKEGLDDSVPPIPPKDAARTEVNTSTFRLAESNFQKPEIWKRRTSRSNSDLSFDSLKLSKSNGSTAGSPPRVQAPERSLPPIPSDLPKEKIVLRKALRSPPPRPKPQPDYMGAKNSKLGLRKKESHGSSTSRSSPTQIPIPKRLPTPEYQKTDRQLPRTPTLPSPVSPVSPESPDLPTTQKSPGMKKVNKLFQKKSAPALPQVQIQKSLDSDFTYMHSRSSSDTLTVSVPTASTVFSAPQPHKPAAKILTPLPKSPSEVTVTLRSPPLPTTSPREVTLNVRSPPPQTTSPFSARAILFQNAGNIRESPPVNSSHYDCYQNHRFMRPSNNVKCPLGCMICDKRDKEKRWGCTWCNLRICTECMEILAGSGKDLKVIDGYFAETTWTLDPMNLDHLRRCSVVREGGTVFRYKILQEGRYFEERN